MTGDEGGHGQTQVVQLRPDLVVVDGRPGQAYLLRRSAGVLLVDAGRRGLAPGRRTGR